MKLLVNLVDIIVYYFSKYKRIKLENKEITGVVHESEILNEIPKPSDTDFKTLQEFLKDKRNKVN